MLDHLSIAKGAHTVTLGADLRWIQSDIVGGQLARGLFNFNGRFTGSSFGDFLPGMTSARQFSTVLRGALRERNYTWSHSIDNVTEALGAEGTMVVQDWRNLDGDRGNSGFDRRHRLSAHALVDLPFGAQRRWSAGGRALNALLNGWQLSGIPYDADRSRLRVFITTRCAQDTA